MSKHSTARKIDRLRKIIIFPRKLTWEEWDFIGWICHWPDPDIWPKYTWLPKEVHELKLTYHIWLELPHDKKPAIQPRAPLAPRGQFDQYETDDPKINYHIQIGQ